MKKIVLILCSMISGITVVFAENTAYLCRKCAVYTVTDHTPVSTNCNAKSEFLEAAFISANPYMLAAPANIIIVFISISPRLTLNPII